MPQAQFVEDLTVGAKRYWLVEPLREFDYVIVAPEPSSDRTTVYASTNHGDVTDVKDADGNPLALARFEGEVEPEEAPSRLGYEVAGSLESTDSQSSMDKDINSP